MFFFGGCEKEISSKALINDVVIEDSYDYHYSDIEEYEAYIDQLAKSTGIDIEQASCYKSVQKATKRFEMMMQNIENNLSKGELSHNDVNQLSSLYQAMTDAYNRGDANNAWKYYGAMCSILQAADGFIFSKTDEGWQMITYDESQDPIVAPVGQMIAIENDVNNITTEMQNNNPSFSSLSKLHKMNLFLRLCTFV